MYRKKVITFPNKSSFKPVYLLILIFTTIFFIFAVSINSSPLLRGPAPYPPDWQWPYLFTPTFQRLWAPLLLIFLLFGWYHLFISRLGIQKVKREVLFLFGTIFLFACFQVSLLFYSRSGVSVLLQRIINPDINGYFTTALRIKDMHRFFSSYNDSVLSFSMHATGHPPGAILFFYWINQLAANFPKLSSLVIHMTVHHKDVESIWISLSATQQLGAIFAGVFVLLLSSLVLLPVYLLARLLFGTSAAAGSILLYLSIPSASLFLPINDTFLAIFSITSLYLLCKGLKEQKLVWGILAGIFFSVGLFFSISLAPFLLLFFLLFVGHLLICKINPLFLVKLGLCFLAGITLLPLLLFVYSGYNSIQVFMTLLKGLPKSRFYRVWVFYNLYDFFMFAGIPLLVLSIGWFHDFYQQMKHKKYHHIDLLGICFFGMLFCLDVSGSVRGEVARIWLPFYPVLAISIASYLLNRLHISKKMFLIIVLLQFLQTLVFQTVLVTLW